ncbi:MAG: hypothetical protein CMH81_02915 [Nitrospiraceae bacterium]|nr:hypothetical protein [Nitrospiraceae bacterium]
MMQVNSDFSLLERIVCSGIVMPFLVIFIVFSLGCESKEGNRFGVMHGYNDCIIEAMKGVQSNIAAQEIKRVCRDTFPSAEEEMKRTEQKAKQVTEIAQGMTQEFFSTKRFAENGQAWAQYDLGVMYANGMGVPKDDQKATRWWKKAAEVGHMDAKFNLDLR